MYIHVNLIDSEHSRSNNEQRLDVVTTMVFVSYKTFCN